MSEYASMCVGERGEERERKYFGELMCFSPFILYFIFSTFPFTEMTAMLASAPNEERV